MVKTYSIQFTSPTHYGAISVSARSAREALAYARKQYPGAVIDSFAVEVSGEVRDSLVKTVDIINDR